MRALLVSILVLDMSASTMAACDASGACARNTAGSSLRGTTTLQSQGGIKAFEKVPGASSCSAQGLQDYHGTAEGCRAAAESVGYNFDATAKGGHAVPVIHEPDETYQRTCVVCENMIYAGRPSLLFWDKASGPNSCEQDGQQTKFHICSTKAFEKVSGASSCNAQGLQDYDGTAAGCRAAAESVGYNFDATAKGGHAVPVIHEPDETYRRTCVVCENMIYAGRPSLLFWDKANGPNSCDQDGQQTKYHICSTEAFEKVSGASSCNAQGLHDYDGSAEGCRAAAESVGYNFDATAEGGHAVPVIHEPHETYQRTCVVCENMIYAGRPSLLFWDKPNGPNSCDQDGQQTKYHICSSKALQKITLQSQDEIKALAKVSSGATSCNAQGLQDYAGTAEGCRAAAESVGYNFDATAVGGHAVPVVHEPDEVYQRTCVVCENMIYAGRPSLLFWDKPKGPSSCNQDGQQTKHEICSTVAFEKVSGASSCIAQGLQNYDGTAEGCRAAAESVGYNFDATAKGGHAVPVIHEPDDTYQRTCVVCENMIYAGRPSLLFWDKANGPNSCDQDGQQTKYHICSKEAFEKVSGASSCNAQGLQDFDGSAEGCRAAAESAGYNFFATAKGGHAVPVIHEPHKTYPRTCVVCENMIYAGRPSLLFWDKPNGPNSCDQDGQQTKYHICSNKAFKKVSVP